MAFAKKKIAQQSAEDSWTRTGTCVQKPAEGWIHSEAQMMPEAGVCYGVKYIGSLDVYVSTRSLTFDERTMLAKEAISRVADAAGLKNVVKHKKKLDKRLAESLDSRPNLDCAGCDITLLISIQTITMMNMDTNQAIITHQMHDVAFVSGGDADTIDFVAYIAKDHTSNRACHILECGQMTKDVILSIAQAFEMRYKTFLNNKRKPMVLLPDREVSSDSAWGDHDTDPTYYNTDPNAFPGASPPDGGQSTTPPPPIPPLPDQYNAAKKGPVPPPIAVGNGVTAAPRRSPASPVYQNSPSEGPQSNGGPSEAGAAAAGPSKSGADQVDTTSTVDQGQAQASSQNVYSFAGADTSPKDEIWFHGKLGRREAEQKLLQDGDFLVRESSNKVGQYVLSGMKNALVIHLLLVDPEGVVRTKDRTFDSVTHLIDYHKNNKVPILSQDIELHLLTPISAI